MTPLARGSEFDPIGMHFGTGYGRRRPRKRHEHAQFHRVYTLACQRTRRPQRAAAKIAISMRTTAQSCYQAVAEDYRAYFHHTSHTTQRYTRDSGRGIEVERQETTNLPAIRVRIRVRACVSRTLAQVVHGDCCCYKSNGRYGHGKLFACHGRQSRCANGGKTL